MNMYRSPLFLFIIFISSCSINSAQYSFMKNQIISQKQELDANWTLTWFRKNIDIYAVNDQDFIYFINFDKVFIKFDGWQVNEVSGLFPNNSKMIIQKDGPDLIYIINNQISGTDKCDDWVEDPESDLKKWKQICHEEIIDYNYTNSIVMNENKEIVGFKFKISNEYPPVIMRMNDYSDLVFD